MRNWKLLALPAVAIVAVAGAEMLWQGDGDDTAVAAELPEPGYGPQDFSTALERSASDLALARERAENQPEDWLAQALLASALMDLGQLRGDFASLVEAQEVITRANDLAPEDSGASIIAAYTAMGAHRLGEVEAALDRYDRKEVAGPVDEQAEVLAIRGDLAFYRGNMEAARTHYRAAASLAELPGVIYRQALLAKAEGEFDEADALLRRSLRAMESPTPRNVANISMQLGGIAQARGQYDEAREHFIEADRLFPGFWLFESHVAQADYLIGNHDAALERLEALLARGPQPVDVTELYALLLQTEGRDAEAAELIAPVTAEWDRRLAALPEAAYGHAIEHHFKFGSPERALELAQRNLELRPYGEACLLMAEALLEAGEPAQALEQIRMAKHGGWLSAPHLRAEINALEALGRDAEARPIREDAEAINPYVFEPESELVWFSHG